MEASGLNNGREGEFFTNDDLHFFNEGTHLFLHHKLGAHLCIGGDGTGTRFAVWAPNAERVSVIGAFNGWDKTANMLARQGASGIWGGFISGVGEMASYKFHIQSQQGGYAVDKADPYGFHHELPPKTGSLVCGLDYEWNDGDWMRGRGERGRLDRPVSIYEVHLGSWMRVPEENNRWLTYREIAPKLAEHVLRLGFTHIEFLPLTEHPFYGSWGYQTTGYFAPTSRYGGPQDLMFLINHLHESGIGVILDWVPSHFPGDEHGLAFFDGTHLYEHEDRRQRLHPDWDSYIFNYGRPQVRSFLLSSACFWLEKYHIDGLRLDAVASMLYLDYSRKPGEWVPNRFGGRENLEAIEFLRQFNTAVYRQYPDVQTIAEESTAWPMVSRPTYVGGLGFGYKWDMGYMHDTLKYFQQDPVFRKYSHNELTFRGIYAFTENFVLPFSHDEVVHGKGSLLAKMPGDDWQKLANLRLLIGHMFLQPGKKMLFMGAEFGQWREWDHDSSLDWHLCGEGLHDGVQKWVADLNVRYRFEPALHQCDAVPGGFEWVDCHDSEQCTLSWLRRGASSDVFLAVCNFTPVLRRNYRVGVPEGGRWHEVLNSDARHYGGSGQGNFGGTDAIPFSFHGRPWALNITLPPLALVCFKHEGGGV
jgi:1,4-alpha-glucan branching enzyme